MQRPWLALTGLLAFLGLGALEHAGVTQRLDVDAVQRCLAHQTASLRTLLQGISLLGSGWMLTLVVFLSLVAVLRKPYLRLEGLRMLVAIGGGEVLVNGTKWFYHRPRPSPIYANLGYSFPSGHSFFSFTVYSLLASHLTRTFPEHKRSLWTFAALLVLAVGISRVAVGVHYPTDVAAGFALALPWLWVCHALHRKETAG